MYMQIIDSYVRLSKISTLKLGSMILVFSVLRAQSAWSMSRRSSSLNEMPQITSLGRRPTSHRYICTKVLLAEGEDTPFTKHCRNYENSYQVRHRTATFQYKIYK